MNYLLRLYLTIILAFCTQSLVGTVLYAHNTTDDSMQSAVAIMKQSRSDTSLVLALNDLAHSFRVSAPNRGVEIAKEAVRIADTLHFFRGKALAARTLGWCYFSQSLYAPAMEAYLEGQKAAEEGGFLIELAQIIQYKAIIYRILDDTERALEEHLRAARILRHVQSPDSAVTMDLWEDIGIDYRLVGTPPKALEYLRTALLYFERQRDTVNLAITHHNIGECYFAQRKYPEALEEFKKTALFAEIKSMRRIIVFNHIALTRLYNALNKPLIALTFGKDALGLARQANERFQLKEAYRAVAQSYALLGDFRQAHIHTTLYSTLQDSIVRENVRHNFALQQTDVAAFEREARIRLLTQEKVQQQRIAWGLGSAVIFLVGFAGILYRTIRSERLIKSELERQQALLTEQAIEIELANNGLQQRNLELERTRDEMEELNTSLFTINEALADRNTALEESYQSVRVLSEIGTKITSTLDIYSIGMALYDDINKILDTPIIVVGTYSPDKQEIDYTLTIENGRRLGELKLSMSEIERPAVQCILQRKPIVVQEFQQTALHGSAPQSLVYVPLINASDEIIGVFSVQSYHKHYFTEQHLNILHTIVPFVTSALTNANAYREVAYMNQSLEGRNRIIDKERESVERERQKSDALLLNILPAPIAARLKAGERPIADRFDSVTVLFADIVDFTKLSATTTPAGLVSMLDTLFSRFDSLAEEFGLEKIKTIGDAYMVVGGLPIVSDDHTERVARFAQSIQSIMEELANEFELPALSVRIGIHCGVVVAGVIGTKKFAYDLWGDTVNTASRMESHGEAGKIHVSEEVYKALGGQKESQMTNDRARNQPMTNQPMSHDFLFEERGKMKVKGKGEMRTWFLLSAPQSEVRLMPPPLLSSSPEE